MKLQNLQEVDRQLQELVPKLTEVNAICEELGKRFIYEPGIITEIQLDGRRMSRVIIKVYVDKDKKDVYSQLYFSTFLDTVYLRLKEMYDNYLDEDQKFNVNSVDELAFGFDLDNNNSNIGVFYIFLMTLYNLIEIK